MTLSLVKDLNREVPLMDAVVEDDGRQKVGKPDIDGAPECFLSPKCHSGVQLLKKEGRLFWTDSALAVNHTMGRDSACIQASEAIRIS